MKFLILMFNDEEAWNAQSPAEQEAAVAKLEQFSQDLRAKGAFVDSHGLEPGREAVSVRRLPGGGRSLTDGPYAETKELVGGYYVIQCDSRSEAVEWLERLPLVTWNAELRRVQGD